MPTSRKTKSSKLAARRIADRAKRVTGISASRGRLKAFAIGDHVETTMGVRRQGVVIAPLTARDANDGTYRAPTSSEKANAVWVKWNDGTRGWSHRQHLGASSVPAHPKTGKPALRVERIERAIFKYDDLDERAQEKALQFASEGAMDYEWWDDIYEDAATFGLKITEFDLDRNHHVKGRFTKDAEHTAKAIYLANHGDSTDTYVLADQFLHDTAALRETLDKGMEGFSIAGESSDEYDEALKRVDDAERTYDEACEEFLRGLCEEYASLLQSEADYRQSREALEETIRENEWTFDEHGNFAD